MPGSLAGRDLAWLERRRAELPGVISRAGDFRRGAAKPKAARATPVTAAPAPARSPWPASRPPPTATTPSPNRPKPDTRAAAASTSAGLPRPATARPGSRRWPERLTRTPPASPAPATPAGTCTTSRTTRPSSPPTPPGSRSISAGPATWLGLCCRPNASQRRLRPNRDVSGRPAGTWRRRERHECAIAARTAPQPGALASPGAAAASWITPSAAKSLAERRPARPARQARQARLPQATRTSASHPHIPHASPATRESARPREMDLAPRVGAERDLENQLSASSGPRSAG
jgi:hypothetical protein